MLKRYPREYFVRRTERLIQRRITIDRYSRSNMVRTRYRGAFKQAWVPYKQRQKVNRPFKPREIKCNLFCTQRGYAGVTMFNDHTGTWCGYIAIPRTHPLFGREYDEALPFIDAQYRNFNELVNQSPLTAFSVAFCSRGVKRLDALLEVHGGLTYSGLGPWYPTRLNNVSWLGFDCGHCGDGKSPEWLKAQIEKYRKSGAEVLAGYYQEELDGTSPITGTFRTESYVRKQIEKMADQLYMLGKLIPKHPYFRKAR